MKAELTKGDVYVVVDTPKKAKKLKNLLNMFKEPMFTIPNNERSSHNGTDYGWGYGFCNDQWQGFNTKSIAYNGKEFKKVSIKELRNILAKEHLREGDYVVCENNFICRIDKLEDFGIHFSNPFVGLYDISYFKRYATPEEIALLEPKQKELEVGKWYKYSYNCNNKHYGYLLFNFNGSFGEDSQIGFTHTSTGQVFVDDISIYNERISEYTDANPQEVESALIEEAKRRYRVGDIIKCFDKVESEVEGLDFVFNNNNLFLNGEKVDGSDWFNTSAKVFDNGKWAEVIDKFAELKESHKKGSVIEVFIPSAHKWYELNGEPIWIDNFEYRIKPEEPIKVGDWMFNPSSKKITQVKKDNHGKSLIGSGWVKIKDAELVEKLNSL